MSEAIRYRVQWVDGKRPGVARDLLNLHHDIFGFSAPPVQVWSRENWFVYADEGDGWPGVVGFAIMEVKLGKYPMGYLARSGVLKAHRGHGLQVRLIRAREAKARKLGLECLVSDTTDNPESARNLARCGYDTYTPQNPWAFKHSLYWRKYL